MSLPQRNSTLPKRWLTDPTLTPEVVSALSAYHPVIRQLLFNRNIHTATEADTYLNAKPPADDDPLQLTGMGEAIERIEHAIANHEPIAVYGDYDTDGVTSAALLVQTLTALGAEVRAYIPHEPAIQIAADLGVEPKELPDLVTRLLQLGPDLLSRSAPESFPGGPLGAVALWKAVWEALRLEERYVPIEELDAYRVTPSVSGEVLRPIIEANGDIRMHVSNGAATSFLDSLPLLHPFGILQCHDIFVTDIQQYQTSFRGPGKYDGSVVNWINGPLLAAIGRRTGYEVKYESFAHRAGSNVMTMTARVRE